MSAPVSAVTTSAMPALMPGIVQIRFRTRETGRRGIAASSRRTQLRCRWRLCGVRRNNTVLAARFEHLTTRENNRLARQQARAACAASLLRWLHVVVTRGVAWDATIAAGTSSTPMAA